MEFLLSIVILLACTCSHAESRDNSEIQLILHVGEKKVISSRAHLTLAKNSVLLIKDLGQAYEINALKSGSAQFRLGQTFYRISVLHQKQLQTLATLQNLTKSTLGLKAEVANGQVFLTGKLINLQDWFKIAEVCKESSCEYVAKFQVSDLLKAKLQTRLSEKSMFHGFSSFRIIWSPEIHLIVPDSQIDIQSLTLFCKNFGISIQKEKSTIELAPSIEVQILIVEMKKQSGQKIGIQWPTAYSAQLLPKIDTTESLMISAAAFENAGYGKVLASPRLICRSGKESEFLAGGEIPIKIISQRAADVIWKKYGILLKLKPVADFSGRMSLGIETEISKIDTAHTIDGIPGFETSRVQSYFDLIGTRTIALSGLLRQDQGESRQGLPTLSRIPILGALFSSQEYQKQETELVILVRPRVITETGDSK